jgi:cell division protein ZapD
MNAQAGLSVAGSGRQTRTVAHRPLLQYEYPLNERIRALLRLEDLFERFELFSLRDDPHDHHVALLTLFEILEVTARGDLRSDLLQEFERQRQTINSFRGNPSVSVDALEATLGRIEYAVGGLNGLSGRTGQNLRDNEWLMSIRSRTGIAGGACEFDLPSYYAWQNRPVEARREDIVRWAAPLQPLQVALTVVLGLLRRSGTWVRVSSQQASYQQPLGGRIYQMVQVRLDPAMGAIPEISANRYLLWIRFTSQSGDQRPRAFEGDVDFELALCNL